MEINSIKMVFGVIGTDNFLEVNFRDAEDMKRVADNLLNPKPALEPPIVPMPNLEVIRFALMKLMKGGDIGGKIAAIKLVRAVSGMGLKESKDYVESLDLTQPW